MRDTLPNFVIIGAMKCGTSTLHEQLARQPGMFMSEPKEPNYFSNDDVYARGEQWYRGLFRGAGAAVLRGESSTHYTKLPSYPRTVERMRALLPELKLIYIMRHPVDRLISHYIHEWSMRVIDAPIDEALDRHHELIDYGCYRMQLQPFFDAYGRANVLPVFLEHMRYAPLLVLERACRFLGYPGSPRWVESVAKQNESAERLRLGALSRRLIDNPVLARLRRLLIPQSLRTALKERLTMRVRPELSAPARARAVSRFDEDLGKLGREFGIELNCATFKQRVSGKPLEWI